MKVLCIDIGSKTQDIVFYLDYEKIENCPKFVLPSPAMLVSEKIIKLSKEGKNIYLYGYNMGGGFKREIKKHIDQGLKVAAHPEAAVAIKDDLNKVKELGVEISLICPKGYVPLFLTDFDPLFWESFLKNIGFDSYDLVLVAAQDHGYHHYFSNRRGRFKIWEQLLSKDLRVEDLLFENPPSNLTRLKTIHSITAGPVADTSSAAALGVLFDKEVEERNQKEGICVVNAGNSHVTAFLIYQNRIFGLYEQHTSNLSSDLLQEDLEKFCKKRLTFEEVFSKKGHGCFIKDSNIDFSSAKIFAIGPRRELLKGWANFVYPGGDVMVAGCYGLIKAAKYKGIL